MSTKNLRSPFTSIAGIGLALILVTPRGGCKTDKCPTDVSNAVSQARTVAYPLSQLRAAQKGEPIYTLPTRIGDVYPVESTIQNLAKLLKDAPAACVQQVEQIATEREQGDCNPLVCEPI